MLTPGTFECISDSCHCKGMYALMGQDDPIIKCQLLRHYMHYRLHNMIFILMNFNFRNIFMILFSFHSHL